jgi:hypothetical protein
MADTVKILRVLFNGFAARQFKENACVNRFLASGEAPEPEIRQLAL